MKKTWLAAMASLALVACGGGGGDDDRNETLVSFGDSLSDVGSYRTEGIAALGGGKFTVNGPDGLVWVEQLARRLDLPAPCAAQTGLQASGPFAAIAGPVVNHPACTAYGQGGARVSDPVGPWNAALLQSPDPALAFSGQLGQLTVPVATQVTQHLAAHGGRFTGKELVVVLAGANDVFVQSDAVARGFVTPADAATAMATAGAELAALVRTQMVGQGAKRVLVMNLPDIGGTPATMAAEAAAPGARAVTDLLTQSFNAQLASGLAGTGETVVQIDLYTRNSDQLANPQRYGLSNVTTPACSNGFFDVPGFLAPSLICTTATTVATDVSRYLYADGVHPTPYGHQLLSDMAMEALEGAGWD